MPLCRKCNIAVLKPQQGYICLRCFEPEVDGCFSLIRRRAENYRNQKNLKHKVSQILRGVLSSSLVSSATLNGSMEEHKNFEAWIENGFTFTSAIRTTRSLVKVNEVENCKREKDYYETRMFYGPFLVDRFPDIAVSRIANIPTNLRSWCVTLWQHPQRPVTMYLDLECYLEEWAANRFQLLNEFSFHSDKTFKEDVQMEFTLGIITKLLNKVYPEKEEVHVSDWWVYQNDRICSGDSKANKISTKTADFQKQQFLEEEIKCCVSESPEKAKAKEKEKKKEEKEECTKTKISRRAYLPTFEFPCLADLAKFMQIVKQNIEIQILSLLDSQKKDDGEKEHQISQKIWGEEQILLESFSYLALPTTPNENKKLLWTHYIDFLVYNSGRHMRLPTCVKSTVTQDKNRPLTLVSAGSKAWYSRYLQQPYLIREPLVSQFSKKETGGTGIASNLEKRPRISSFLENNILEVQTKLRDCLKSPPECPIDPVIQILSGMITHPPEKGWTQLFPKSQIEGTKVFQTSEKQKRALQRKRKEIETRLEKEIQEIQEKKGKKFTSLSQRERTFQQETKHAVILSSDDISKFPPGILERAARWLKKKGDETSEIKLIKYFVKPLHRQKAEFENKVFIAEVRSLHHERRCFTGAIHEKGRNGGFFEIHFFKKSSIENHTRGWMRFHCFGSQCKQELAHKISIAVAGDYKFVRQ